MAGPARDDGGVKLYAAAAAGALLTGLVLTGCGSGSPAGQGRAGGTAGPSGPVSSPAMPGSPVASGSPSSSNEPNGTARPVAGGGTSGPGCAAWPASTKTTLLITWASNGQRYCVRTGETVQVSSAGRCRSGPAKTAPAHRNRAGPGPGPARRGDPVTRRHLFGRPAGRGPAHRGAAAVPFGPGAQDPAGQPGERGRGRRWPTSAIPAERRWGRSASWCRRCRSPSS